MAGFIVILTLLLSFTPSLHSTTTATSATTNLLHHYRRILHHPLFPVDDSLPPSPSPQPEAQSQQPKYPFSSQSPPKQFFPNYPSPPPPPPPPTAVATFPANISSLILPQSSSSSKPISRKLVAVAVSVSLLSIALIAAIAAFLLHYHTKYHPGSSFFSDKDTTRTDSLRLFPPNTATSDGVLKPPPYRNVASTSSEFLYLGTLVSSREVDEGINRKASNPSNAGTASVSGYQRLGSPELHPLPPLSRHNFRANNRNADMGSSDDEGDNEEEEFFSPRGSPPAEKYSPTHAGSSSRREFEAVQGENFKSRSFNSNPYSNSASSTHSMSTSPSIPLNLSPSSLRSKSPDSVVNFPSPSKPISPPQPPQERTSQSPFSGDTQNSPARISVISGLNQLSPPRKPSDSGQYAPVKLPPPPPPLPPPRFWEVPFLHMRIRDPVIGPPELVTPSRPIVLGGEAQNSGTMERNDELSKPKLKPLHWDKVRASSDRAMVWDQLKSSSFQLNEEMIETLFMVNSSNFTPKDSNNRPPTGPSWNQENQVLDPKKSQNIAILLRALNVTVDEVCEALLEGNTDTLGTELLESLLKMAPTKEEERKLKDFKEESSPFKLGTAEKFLKAVLDIPFAFKRVDAMLYIANFDSEVEYLIKSFETLEAACRELKNSRMFLKLLETVLKTGNRMNVGTNRGDAHAFKLDTLLKLVDVKGTDGKTTLLHFVVQEIIRAEGYRLSGADQEEKQEQSDFREDVEFRKLGLQVVSGLSGELTQREEAAAMDSDVLSSEVSKLAAGIAKIGEVVKLNEEAELRESSGKFSESMNGFLRKAEEEIVKIQTEESMALSMVKEITEYFHGSKEEAHPFRIFVVVRDFLSILDHVCKEVGKINDRTIVSSGRQFQPLLNPSLPSAFPGLNARRQYSSSSDNDYETSSSMV